MSSSRSEQRTIAARYASAMFDVARDKHCHEQVASDLMALCEVVESSAQLVKAMNNPTLAQSTKLAIMNDVLNLIKAHGTTKELVAFVVTKKRAALMADVAKEFQGLCLAFKGELTANVTSAQPMSAAQIDQIADRLTKTAGKKVNISQTHNPALLGGYKITLGSRMLDASLLGRLQRLSAQLMA